MQYWLMHSFIQQILIGHCLCLCSSTCLQVEDQSRLIPDNLLKSLHTQGAILLSYDPDFIISVSLVILDLKVYLSDAWVAQL